MRCFGVSWFLHNHEIPHPNQWGSMSDILFVFFVGSTKIGEITDISKCFENFVSQALGVLTRIYAAELRSYFIIIDNFALYKLLIRIFGG